VDEINAKAQADRSEYEALLNSIYDGVLVVDADGSILETNTRALEYFRYPPGAMRGMNVTKLLAHANEVLLQSIHRNLEHHRYTLIEGQCVRADHRSFPAEIAVSRLPRGGDMRLCFFVRNVTERKRAQDALKDAVARLEEHDQARVQFVSNVSHELKTPLTSMLYAIYNMLSGVTGPLPARVRRYLQMLDGDCRRMLTTVGDILDLRRIDNKTLKLDRQRVPVGRLVRWAMESLQLQARQKSIAITTNMAPRNIFIECDPAKIERVVINVVGNAIKFTPPGGTVEVDVSAAVDLRGFVRIRVDDTGPGIPKEAIPRVSERYFTVGEQPLGTGLGLAISKEIVELHGGTLKIESPVPKARAGTRVSVTLPVSDPPRVMLVEDDGPLRETVSMHLEDWGFRVEALGDGATALESIKRSRPELLLLDLHLPGLEGTDVILKLKANLEMMRTPVIVMTGLRLNEKQKKILGNFGIPTLTKPWTETELREQVETAFLGTVSAIRRPVEKKPFPAPTA
ncbi:MAG: hybrid sensor histidine kinase/response regulator, partial [Verrucomicrobia bacterium]|nr:hybrid sensor histidine kinase/response regulator [Verrucomicrobiota bacterium]